MEIHTLELGKFYSENAQEEIKMESNCDVPLDDIPDPKINGEGPI